MRKRVPRTGEESPPAPLFQRGENNRDTLNRAPPPLKKGGQGGFGNTGKPTKASHAR